MPWKQPVFLFGPSGKLPWSKTHAQVPTPLLLANRIRIYYSTRDVENKSRTGFIDVARDNPAKILYVHDQPILPLGKPGTFDEDGVMVSSIVAEGQEVWLYYTGWSCSIGVPYHVSAGLMKSNDEGMTFSRIYEGPVVDRTPHEAYTANCPYVLKEGKTWHMWYGSGTGWVDGPEKKEPLYIIKYAKSHDGIHWQQDNITCIEPLHPLEANTRASVIRGNAGYEMWFTHRHSVDFRDGAGSYRIGYATSKNGLKWQRHADLEELSSNWSNRMMAYPYVIDVDGKRIMFFNGNGFGVGGFGYSVWES